MRSPHTTTKSSPPSPQLEKAHMQQQRSNTAKINKEKKKEKKLKEKNYVSHLSYMIYISRLVNNSSW